MSTTTYNVMPGSPLAFPGSREYVFECVAGGPVTLTQFNEGESEVFTLGQNEPVERAQTDRGEYQVNAIGHAKVRVTENREAEKARE